MARGNFEMERFLVFFILVIQSYINFITSND